MLAQHSVRRLARRTRAWQRRRERWYQKGGWQPAWAEKRSRRGRGASDLHEPDRDMWAQYHSDHALKTAFALGTMPSGLLTELDSVLNSDAKLQN